LDNWTEMSEEFLKEMNRLVDEIVSSKPLE
jgi:hypothetical protein